MMKDKPVHVPKISQSRAPYDFPGTLEKPAAGNAPPASVLATAAPTLMLPGTHLEGGEQAEGPCPPGAGSQSAPALQRPGDPFPKVPSRAYCPMRRTGAGGATATAPPPRGARSALPRLRACLRAPA